MSTSEPLETGRLVLSAAMPGVAFTVVDGTFQAVARGVGTLDAELPEGIYEISVRAGGSVSTELISLHPGETYKRTDITAGVYAAAPLPGSATANPEHAAAVTAASSRVASAQGPAAGLVVAVRRTADGATVLHHEQLTVLDRELRTVDLPDWEAGDGIAVLGTRLEPGAYVLRLKPDQGPALDQTVWLSDGWQTLVFCPNGADRADLDDASVHLGRLGQAFPGDAEDLATAVEIATSGLRQGLPLVNENLLQVLRDRDFANPMLGITGAHALLLRGDPPSLTEFCEVAAELRSILPDHPDVLALATHPACQVAGTSVSWPPMLAASYDKLLLPADQIDTDSILDGSPAERVAGYVVQRGPWLCWEATEAMLRPAPLPALPSTPDEQTQLLSATTEGASRRLQKHVLEVANLTGNSQPQVAGSLGAAELAKRLQLPIQTVRAVLAELGWDDTLLGTGPITTIDETEERLDPVPRGTSPFAGPLPDPVYETGPKPADTDDKPAEPAEPAEPVEKPPEPVKPKPDDGPDRRWIFILAGVVTAILLVVAGARVFGGSGGGGGDVTLEVASMPDFFDRNAVPSQNITVAMDGNSEPQQVDARVDAAEYAADTSGCKAVPAGRTCVIRVMFKPGPKENQPKLANLVLSTTGSDELTIPLYGTSRNPEGNISVDWTEVKDARVGETIRPTVYIDNIPPGAVHSVVRVTVPDGFEIGTFDAKDKCDARRGTVIFCWVGLDDHHDDWAIRIPLIARSGTGGPIKVDAQLSRNRDIPDPDPGDNTAEATITITGN